MVEHHVIYLHCVTAVCITKITIVPLIVNGVNELYFQYKCMTELTSL
jgi:hypothetical protein